MGLANLPKLVAIIIRWSPVCQPCPSGLVSARENLFFSTKPSSRPLQLLSFIAWLGISMKKKSKSSMICPHCFLTKVSFSAALLLTFQGTTNHFYSLCTNIGIICSGRKQGMQSIATYISLHGSSTVLKEAFSAQQSPVGLGLASGLFHI